MYCIITNVGGTLGKHFERLMICRTKYPKIEPADDQQLLLHFAKEFINQPIVETNSWI